MLVTRLLFECDLFNADCMIFENMTAVKRELMFVCDQVSVLVWVLGKQHEYIHYKTYTSTYTSERNGEF